MKIILDIEKRIELTNVLGELKSTKAILPKIMKIFEEISITKEEATDEELALRFDPDTNKFTYNRDKVHLIEIDMDEEIFSLMGHISV